MLFYLQRTINRNTLIYELNYEATGEINSKEPIKVYWIDFEYGGGKSELTFAQRKFAYGVRSNRIDKIKNIYEISLVSYDHIKIRIAPYGSDNLYRAEIVIKDKIAILDKILIQIVGGTHVNPLISFIELTGHDPGTGALVSERIKPKR